MHCWQSTNTFSVRCGESTERNSMNFSVKNFSDHMNEFVNFVGLICIYATEVYERSKRKTKGFTQSISIKIDLGWFIHLYFKKDFGIIYKAIKLVYSQLSLTTSRTSSCRVMSCLTSYTHCVCSVRAVCARATIIIMELYEQM